VVTGANTGIGFETAKELAKKGFNVIMVCRSMEKGKDSARIIESEFSGAMVHVMKADLASFASIKTFSSDYLKMYDRLDLLVNNAGVFSDTHQKTEDGFEMTMGVNYLGNYLITQLLRPVILKTEKARVINIASKAGFHGKINLTNPFHGPSGFKAYSASKLALIWWTIHLAKELKDTDVKVVAVSPGRGATNIWKGKSFMMKIVRPIMLRKAMSAAKCSQTGLYTALAEDNKISSGSMYENLTLLPYNKRCLDYESQQALMKLTREITGVGIGT